MKPKVLHLIGDKRAGGSNRLVKQLVESKLSEDFEFLVLRLEEAKPQLKSIKPDIIIFHYPCAWKYLVDLFLLKRSSKVFIYDHHYCEGFEREQVPSPFRFHLMLRLAYSLVDGVLSVSQVQRQWAIDRRLVSPEKVKTISPASVVDEMLKIPAKNTDFPLIIGAYGRFARQKGFDLLLKAFALLPPEQFQLHLGGYGPDEETIEELARELPQVKLLGTITDVPAFLASCDAIAIPSRWEPWGLTCLEAKAAGKPVIAAAVDGLCEQVRDCGLLVPANNVEQLADALAALPKQNLEAWGKAGRNSVINAWEEFCDRTQAFLEQAIAETKNLKISK
ncbi:glycosyltransferase family 4 protein [Candidatus Gracilibacteria bacterium]|nr:glycosyltransferase family 4 protein [Candidatus Gracilibacteria bacterium]NJM88333.1 glycosyltransferase family 4 protein [Hydrococcus sp. RU_2_2]NJP20877.1 glycosyltransferase family 4 protein [Hydrococcus sp. CRU_1_1]